jgi:hypothetical protein
MKETGGARRCNGDGVVKANNNSRKFEAAATATATSSMAATGEGASGTFILDPSLHILF